MVYSWGCSRCEFVVWSETKSPIRQSVQSHLLEHHRDALFTAEFQVGWACPYCSAGSVRHDGDESVREFKRHLFTHETDRLRSTHRIADEFGGSGNALVLAPPNSSGADVARTHFFAGADVLFLVTMNVSERIRQLDRQLSEWPTRTVVLTTKTEPLAGTEGLDIDVGDVPLDVVELDKGLGLAALGRSISRAIADHESSGLTLSLAFEVLSEIVSKYELKQVFQFVHLLTTRLEKAGSVSHFYYTPESRSSPQLNMLSELFDLRIEANAERLVRPQ